MSKAVLTQRIPLAIGKASYDLDEAMGDPAHAEITGQRGRPYPLVKLATEDFKRNPTDLRGIPQSFCTGLGKIALYPVPDRDMELVVEAEPKVLNEGELPSWRDKRTKEYREAMKNGPFNK